MLLDFFFFFPSEDESWKSVVVKGRGLRERGIRVGKNLLKERIVRKEIEAVW